MPHWSNIRSSEADRSTGRVIRLLENEKLKVYRQLMVHQSHEEQYKFERLSEALISCIAEIREITNV